MPETRFKLVVLGTMGVGKTCLTLRFVKGTFDEDQMPTIGAAYMTKKMCVDDKQYILEIWDTAGQERYEAMTPLYYRSAEAAVIVFDITDKESFQKAKMWLKRLQEERLDPDMPIILVGNKADRDERDVDDDQVRAFVEEYGLQYFEASAKTGLNVDDMFSWLVTNLPQPMLTEESESFTISAESPLPNKSSFCC